MKNFVLEIKTPDGPVFSGEAVQLSVRAIDGELAVMADHIPLVTALKSGDCRVYLSSGEVKNADCKGGMLIVTKEKVQLLSSSFEFK